MVKAERSGGRLGEFWGLLLAHFAVRGLMLDAALRADENPDTAAIHCARARRNRQRASASSPLFGLQSEQHCF